MNRLAAMAALAFAAASRALAADAVFPVSEAVCADMKATHVLNANAPVGCERLRLVQFSYVDFEGRAHDDGQVVVMDALADRVLRIFQELKRKGFPIAKAKLMDGYRGDDEASMADDNTSAFNDRDVPGSTRKSLHAYGAAIDINPVENPFVSRQGAIFTFHPAAGADHFNRLAVRPGKPIPRGRAEEMIAIFAENGFLVWGGFWDDPIDWQHFDIGRELAERLAKLPPEEARAEFERHVPH